MSESKPLISIVVPIYNVEKYLKQCIVSCQKQKLKDIEIICVDDGSTDNSLSIVKKMAKKDKRIVIVSKANAGYGNTMNIGMDKARGEYIGIVESDDYVDSNMFLTLYETAKKFNSDVVKSDYYIFHTQNKKNIKSYEHTCNSEKYYNKVLVPKDNKEIFTFQMNTWTGIYRREFLLKNKIRHNETPGASYQDNGFWFQTLSLADSVVFVNKAFYHYRQDNPNSSINSKGKVFCMNEEYAFIRKFIENHPFVKKEFMNEYFKKMFFNYFYTYGRIAEQYKLVFLERFSKELHELQDSSTVQIDKFPDNWIRETSMRIMDDYRKFFYEDKIYQLNERLNNANDRLRRVNESHEKIVGRKIADKILRILRKK